MVNSSELRPLPYSYSRSPVCFLRLNRSAMLQELSHMDRITQLQDEIQQVINPLTPGIFSYLIL